MSRQLRLEFPGAIWHVTSRGDERRDFYRHDYDRERFLRILARVVRERRWILHAWVLMANHYHLLVETPKVGLSRGIKSLNQKYAEGFHRQNARVGHLFQGRFKGILVERRGSKQGHIWRINLETADLTIINRLFAALYTVTSGAATKKERGMRGVNSPDATPTQSPNLIERETSGYRAGTNAVLPSPDLM